MTTVVFVLAGIALWVILDVLVSHRSERLQDDAYVEGWRDGYDLGYAHGANGKHRERQRYEPFIRRPR